MILYTLFNLFQGDHTRAHIENFKFSSSDSKSTWKISLDTSRTILFRQDQPTSFQYLLFNTNLVILDHPLGIFNFPLQIQNPLKNWVQTQFETIQLKRIATGALTPFWVQQVLQAESGLETWILRILLRFSIWFNFQLSVRKFGLLT